MSNYSSSTDVLFDPWSWTDIFTALRQCAMGSCGRALVDKHCQLLRSFGNSVGANDVTLRDAERLAKGFDDLVVIVIDPTDDEDLLPYDEIPADEMYPRTIRMLDQSLRFASQDQRNVDNTIVLDPMPFRSGKFKYHELDRMRKSRDEEANEIFEQILFSLHPKVIILCYFQHHGRRIKLPEIFRSQVMEKGHINVITLGNGHECIGVPSFHPMCFARPDPEAEGYGIIQKIAREYLFDFTFIAAFESR
ncbi:hypothetical protein F4818DRAFT_415208 [Hypoxylon cercidicola]|nr:hypothetical protein F4818DRAFT_415208 [Hypoxylon cercidicola]